MKLDVLNNEEADLIKHAVVYAAEFGYVVQVDFADTKWAWGGQGISHEGKHTSIYSFALNRIAQGGVRIPTQVMLTFDEHSYFDVFTKTLGSFCLILLIASDQIASAAETAQPAAQYFP